MLIKPSPVRPLILAATIATLLSCFDAHAVVVAGNEGKTDANNVWLLPAGTNLLVGAGTSLPNPPQQETATSTSWGTLTNGLLGLAADKTAAVAPANGAIVTFSLDLSGAASGGYSLTSWDSYCAWPDAGRDNQNYVIEYATVSAPGTFVNIATVANVGVGNTTHTSLTDTTGLLGATNVGSIRITFNGQENGYTGFREFVTVGAVTTPDLTWTGASGGAGNATWTTVPDSNWKQTSDNLAQNYASGGKVLFDTTGTNSNITVDGAGVSAIGLTFTHDNTTSYTLSGGTITTGALSASGTGNTTINSVVHSQGGVTKTGTGTLTLGGANTYRGVTTLQGGILNVGSLSDYGVAGALGNRVADFAGGAVGILFRGGTLQYTGATATSTNRAIRINADGGGGNPGGAIIDASGTVPEATMRFTATSSPDFFEFGGNRNLTLTGSNPGDNLFASSIGQTGGTTSVTKTGAGKWLVTGASSYSGVTLMTGGILNASSFSNYGANSSVGNRASDAAGNVGFLFRGGTLQYTGATAQSTNRSIRVSTVGGATLDASGSDPAATLSFTATASPDFYENPGARVLTLTGTNPGNNTFAMNITNQDATVGRTSIVKNGVGTWLLTGNSSYSGQTNINAGTLRITNSAGLGVGTFATETKTTIVDGATVELQGDLGVTEHFHFTGAGVGGNGAIRSLSGNSTLSQSSALDGNARIGVEAGSLTISAALYEELGSFGVTKVGAGTLVLGSASNIYTGATQVNAGTLLVNGSIAASTTTVNSGGTLGGSGTVGGLNVVSGGTVAPGNSPGILTAGNTAFASGSTLSLEINNTTPATGYDQLAVNGSVDLGGATLSLSGSYLTAPAIANDIFYLILNDGGDAASNTFAGLAEGALVFAGNGQGYIISYRAESGLTDASNFGTALGNDVGLMAVPEPGSAFLLSGGLGLLLGLRRRRPVKS